MKQSRLTNKHLTVHTSIYAGKGLGDIVADFTHATGMDKIATAYTDMTGKDCGCSARQETLNQINIPL